MFHPGEKAVQVRAGVEADAWGSSSVGRTIPPVAAEFLGRQRFLAISALDGAGDPWTTQLTGAPGLVRVEADDEIRLTAALSSVDPLADVLGTSARIAPVEVGILALEPTTRRRMRINGTARRVGPDLVITTEQVYANCPKYIQQRRPLSRPATGPDVAGPAVEVAPELTTEHQQLVTAADTFFVATRSGDGDADASHRGGSPGFVRVLGPARLRWPDYSGNAMLMTLGNLHQHPAAGLLVLDWDTGAALQITGTASIEWDPEAAAAEFPGAHRVVDFRVTEVVRTPNALPTAWTAGEPSRFNPPAPAPASP
jgi:hypothetical protein